MYCSKCGTNVAAEAAFCTSCGNPMSRTTTALSPAGLQPAASSPASVSPYLSPSGLPASSSFSYAGFWIRFLAYFIDSLILSTVTIFLLIPLIFLTGSAAKLEGFSQNHGEPDPAVVGALVLLFVLFIGIAIVLQWLYHAYLESGEKQGTWGKQILGLYVTDLLGNRISFGRASGRFFAKIVSGMIPLAIGYIMAAFTERKQALHDMIASCLVLRR